MLFRISGSAAIERSLIRDMKPLTTASATSPSSKATLISSHIASISLSEILPLPFKVAKAEENLSESDSNTARAY